MEEKKNLFTGKVISKKMSKTATVVVETTFKDPRVHKIIKKKKKFHVHDPLEVTKLGDQILFFEGKHISKIKYMYFYAVAHSDSTQK
jgi:small subunit ribosomal protein S17